METEMRTVGPMFSRDGNYRFVKMTVDNSETEFQFGHVYHNSDENDELKLVIQKNSDKTVLKTNEILSLLEFLIKNYSTIRDKDDDQTSKAYDLDPELVDMLCSNPELIKTVYSKGLITEDLIIASIIKERRSQLDKFSNLLSENPKESEWQRWFSENTWVFGSSYVKIIDRKIDIRNEVDFFARSSDGFINIVEIKRSGEEVLCLDKSHNNYRASGVLNEAIAQCINYIRVLNSKSNNIDDNKRLGPILNPECLIIIGSAEEWDDEERVALRSINNSLHGIRIITYDQVRDQASTIINWDETHLKTIQKR